MSKDKFLDKAYGLARAMPDQRLGQVFFNYLYSVRPELADEIRNTDMDPFYVTDPYSPVWDRFFTFIDERFTPIGH
jgi:hypothetical protein